MGEGKVITGVLAGGVRLDQALADASGLSRERVKALMAEGLVSLVGNPVTQASAKAVEGMRFRIAVPEAAGPTPIARKWRPCPRIPRVENTPSRIIRRWNA